MPSVSVMLSKCQIIQKLYDTQFVENYLKTFIRANDVEFVADEVQEIYVIVLQTDEARLQQMYAKDGINGVRRFVSGVIYRQMNSTTSKIHALYRKRQTTTRSTDNMTVKDLEKGMEKLDNLYK